MYKQKEVYARNIEEAERRLADIRRMHEQGLVTRNDCLRSELELTDYRLTKRKTENNWKSTVYIHNPIWRIHLRIRCIRFLWCVM